MSETKHGILAISEQHIQEVESWLGAQIDVTTTTWNEGQWGLNGISWTDSNKEAVLERVFGQTDRQLVTHYEMAGRAGNNGDYSGAASGSYDDKHRRLAKELVDIGMEDTIIRPSAEFNLDWSPRYPNDPSNYASAFARVVREMNSVSGANFSYLYSPARNRIGVADEAWPTNAPEWPTGAEVPIIAPSFYDTGWVYPDDTSNVTQSQREDNWQNEKNKLDNWQNFADERGSPGLASPEWGCSNGGYPINSGGDNPYFIRKAIEYAENNDWLFQAYWNVGSASGGSHKLHKADSSGLTSASEEFRTMVSQRLDQSTSGGDSGSDTSTNYGGYNRPQAGTLDWHVPLNENFEQIEADIEDIAARLENLEN